MAHLHYYPTVGKPGQTAVALNPKLVYAGRVSNLASWKSHPHKHDFCEVLYVAGGQMRFLVGGEAYIARRGDVVLCNPGQVHEEQAMGSTPLRLDFIAATGFAFEGTPENHLLPQGACPVIGCGADAKQMAGLFREVLSETGNPQPFSQSIAKGIVAAILSLAMRLYATSLQRATPAQRVEDIRSYIEKNYACPLNLEDLAQVAHISKYHLAHLFKEWVGISPVKYLTQCRMEKAKQLLQEDLLSTDQIAETIGYADPQYFRRVFRREIGVPPGVFRKGAQAKQ